MQGIQHSSCTFSRGDNNEIAKILERNVHILSKPLGKQTSENFDQNKMKQKDNILFLGNNIIYFSDMRIFNLIVIHSKTLRCESLFA